MGPEDEEEKKSVHSHFIIRVYVNRLHHSVDIP